MPMTSHLEFASSTTPDGHRLFIELHTGKISKIAFDNRRRSTQRQSRWNFQPPQAEWGHPLRMGI